MAAPRTRRESGIVVFVPVPFTVTWAMWAPLVIAGPSLNADTP
jgi:hypothetical protein